MGLSKIKLGKTDEGLKDIAGYINYLEREPVIIDRIGDVKGVGG